MFRLVALEISDPSYVPEDPPKIFSITLVMDSPTQFPCSSMNDSGVVSSWSAFRCVKSLSLVHRQLAG